MNVVSLLPHLLSRLRSLDPKSPADRIRALRIATEAILGVAIAVHGLSFGLQLVRLSAARGLPPVARTDSRALRADSLEVATVIAEAHLFGTPPSRAIAPSETDIPPTRWVLTGTLAARAPGAGKAILGSDDKTHLVKAGEEVAPDYQLAEVFSDHVTLRHAGELMTVMIKRSVKGGAPLGSLQPEALAHTPKEVPPELAERPQNFILADALLQPAPWVDASGNYAGMTLVGKTNASTLKQYGFKDEDVITAVNGRPITSVLTAQKALKEMSKGVPTAVTIVRNGLPTQMSVTLVDDGIL